MNRYINDKDQFKLGDGSPDRVVLSFWNKDAWLALGYLAFSYREKDSELSEAIYSRLKAVKNVKTALAP